MTANATSDASKSRAKNTQIFWIVSIVCVALFAVAFFFVDPKAVHEWAQKVPGWIVFLLMALTPVVGAPVSVLFVVGGAKFGTTGGLIAAGFAIAINLLLTYAMTRYVLRRPIAAFFNKTKYKIPQVPKGESISISLLTALVPGLPYAAKNYLLVLAGALFRVYFWVLLPAHYLHASLAILFGGMTKDLSKGKIIFLVAYGIVITLLCKRVINRLRARTDAREKSSAPHTKNEMVSS